MNDAVITQLQQIIRTYGVAVCEDPRRVEGLLRDLSGQYRREIAVLSGAAREGVPAELLASRGGTPPAVLGQRLVQLLQDNLGMANEAARWAVSAWAFALGVAADVPIPARPAAVQPVTSEPQASAREMVTRLLDQAEDAAASVTSKLDKVGALARVANALAALNPPRAARLFDDAERIAHTYDGRESPADMGELEKAAILMNLANLLAATDPDRALRIAWSFAERFAEAKARVLTRVSDVVAATNPDRAEQLAQSISQRDYKAKALATLAVALKAVDPDRAIRLSGEAERAARSLPDEVARAKALAGVAAVLVAADPGGAARLVGQAERTVQSLTSDFDKSSVLTEVAAALTALDTDRALDLADSIHAESDRNQVMLRAAEALSATNPDRALQIAYSIIGDQLRIEAVCCVGKVVAPADADRAARLLADAERLARAINDDYYRAIALVDVANAWDEVGRSGVRPLPMQVTTQPPADVTGEPAPADIVSPLPSVHTAGVQSTGSSLDPGHGAAETAEWVEMMQFSTTRLRPGYDEEEVDFFLDEIRNTFLGNRKPPLTPVDVRNKQFSTTRVRPGYDEEEVDVFLDEVELRLTAWLEGSAGHAT